MYFSLKQCSVSISLECSYQSRRQITLPEKASANSILGYPRSGLSWYNWRVSFAPDFQCCYFCESSYLFFLGFNFDFYVSKIMHL